MRTIAILLLTAFTLQTFQQAFIVLDYRLNTAAFAQNCENKARPVMRCKGKCQMMKKLQAEEKKKEQHPERKAENRSEVLYAALHLPVLPPPASDIPARYYPRTDKATVPGPSYPIFHPPALI